MHNFQSLKKYKNIDALEKLNNLYYALRDEKLITSKFNKRKKHPSVGTVQAEGKNTEPEKEN